jgi:hypothetical protein
MQMFFERLRQRKVFQWALAYLAVGWVVIQVLQFLSATYGWPPVVLRVAPIVLITGLFVILTVAWFHGERGQQRVSTVEFGLLAVLLVAGSLGAVVMAKGGRKHSIPLVVMMDSPYPRRVYDDETAKSNGTNADVISDILLDLPIRRQKEAIGPAWHRDEEIRLFEPDLVIVHFSAFCQSDPCPTAYERMRQFIDYFADADTEFLIYSRGGHDWSRTCPQDHSCERRLRLWVDSVMADDYREHPKFKSRIHVFGIQDYGPPHWRDQVVANAFKLRVKQLLAIK